MQDSIEIIDFHCHPFYTDPENICIYKDTSSSPDDFLYGIDRSGIGRFCGSVVVKLTAPVSFDPIRQLNDHALELAQLYKGRYIPGIHIHPKFVRESCEELERCKKLGVKLIGELVPYMMGWSGYSSPECIEILSLAGELNMTVSAHPSNEADMEEAVRALPKVNFVFAHPGEYGEYMKHLERIKKYENAYLDISGTGLFRFGMLKYGFGAVGRDRILFGTDYPICNAAMQIGGSLSENLDAEDYRALFYANAARLLELDES